MILKEITVTINKYSTVHTCEHQSKTQSPLKIPPPKDIVNQLTLMIFACSHGLTE